MNDTTNTYKLTFENGSNVTVKSDSIENAKRKVCSRIGASRLGEMVSAILVETKAQQKANTEKAILIATLGECF